MSDKGKNEKDLPEKVQTTKKPAEWVGGEGNSHGEEDAITLPNHGEKEKEGDLDWFPKPNASPSTDDISTETYDSSRITSTDSDTTDEKNTVTLPPPPIPSATDTASQIQAEKFLDNVEVDWSRFAYIQYVTNADYLCNTVMLYETLHRLDSRAKRAIMYPADMLPNPQVKSADYWEGDILIKARDQYGAELFPVEVQHRDTAQGTIIGCLIS